MLSVSKTPLCIGIDLGTTHSLIAVWRDGKATLIPNALGSFLTPSVVSVSETGELLVGQPAKERLLTHPERTASVFKRHMGSGRAFDLEGETHTFSAEDLSALILKSLRADAENALNCTISDVIISVPAYFNDLQRKATRTAAHIAGLNVIRLINEPTAAALSYGLHKAHEESVFMVIDLGGGTLDVSVVELFDNMIEVKSSTGDNQLGGEDFTQVIKRILLEQITHQQQRPALELKQSTQSTQLSEQTTSPPVPYTKYDQTVFLHHHAERCKLLLSQQELVMWKATFHDETFDFSVSQALFEAKSHSLLKRLNQAVERALRDAKVNPIDLKDIVLVGGASRMPIVRQALYRLIGKQLNTTIQPDEAIALGAAILSGLCAQDSALDEVMMTDVCPYSLGIDIKNPNDVRGTDGHLFSRIIERNTLVPVSKYESYSPTEDYQTEVVLNIYQGESRLVRENIKLGKLIIPLPRRKKDNVWIEVRFSYDVSGLLDIDATVFPMEKHYQLSLLGQAHHLSQEEIVLCKEQLNRLKISPRTQHDNQTVLATLKRLSQELTGDEQILIEHEYTTFLNLIDTQAWATITNERERLKLWIHGLEQRLLNTESIDVMSKNL